MRYVQPNHPTRPGETWCKWGPCSAGQVIQPPPAPRETDEHGAEYHPGCRAAMLYAMRTAQSNGRVPQ